MGNVGGTFCLSSVHVFWSSDDEVFVARSDRHPDLVARDEWSSLAAMEALIDLIEQQGPQDYSSDRSAA